MSLHNAAQHLAAHGRGDDKVLVHMTLGEVKSLNDLAKAHGGQLSINPKTGLPEAGFLSSILPMVAGAALGPAGYGLTAMQAGMAAGALSYLANPRGGLAGGLMAGLGAYGGANLGEALAVEGMKAATPTAAQVTPESLRPFTTDPTAYTQFSPTASQYGAFGEPLTGAQVTAGGPGIGNMNSAALNPIGGNPATTIPAGGVSNVSYGMASTPGQPISYSGGNAFYNTTLPPDAAGSFKPSTITNQLASPTASPEDLKGMTFSERLGAMKKGITSGDLTNVASNNLTSIGSALSPTLIQEGKAVNPVVDKDMGQRYKYSTGVAQPLPAPDVPTYDQMLTQQGNFGRQQNYYPNQGYTPIGTDEAKNFYGFAGGGPIERMSNQNAIGANTGFPQAYLHNAAYSTPYQTPISQNVLTGAGDIGVDPYTGEERMARGGLSDAHYNLGGYSDGGRLLRGPGDGVSDSIPAMIGEKQPARLADGEFVVPARIVSELGNGSTEAGARKLYAMMDRVQTARKKTVGKDKVAHNSRADKYLPA